MALADLEKDIEEIVSTRKTGKAIFAIKKYLTHKKSHEGRIKAANWFRRLGLLNSALRVLGSEAPGEIDPSTPKGEEQIILARLLNLQGASRYATRIVSKMNLKKIPDRLTQQAGNIYLSNYFYEKAVTCFTRAIETHPSFNSNTYYLAQISLADAQCGLHFYDKAIKTVENIHCKTNDNLIKFISASALGEYLIKSMDEKKALSILEPYLKLINPEDRSNDLGIYYKWLGVAYILNKNEDEGIHYLKEAMKVLYNPYAKPEGWLEILYFIGYAKFIKSPQNAPKEWLQIMAYPSFNFIYIDKIKTFLGEIFSVKIKNDSFEKHTYPLLNLNEYCLDLISDIEWNNGKMNLGLSLFSEIMSLVIRCGSYKMGRYRLLETIWPKELFSLRSLLLRLENILHQGKKKGIMTISDKGVLSFHHRRKLPAIIIGFEKRMKGLVFLFVNRSFKRKKVEKFFNIPQSTAASLIKEWEKNKIIQKDKEKPYYYISRV